MSQKPLYKVTIFLTEDNRHTPFLVKALLDLEKKGFILLFFKTMPLLFSNRYVLTGNSFFRTKKGYPWCPELIIIDLGTKKECRIGIDLQDWSNFFSYHSIKKCDFVYKRALTKNNFEILDKKIPNFFRPFGPNSYSKINDQRYHKNLKISFYKQLFPKLISNPFILINKAKNIFQISKNLKKDIIFTSNKANNEPPRKAYVFFQVQYYNWENKESKSLNFFRAQLIRLLKRKFKTRFYGGMWFLNKVPIAYKDCITNVDTNIKTYNSFVKNATILISTNGFGGSVPWKLVEFLKLGSCIVAERNKHLLRGPLTKNQVSFFDNQNECINLCEKLLQNKKLIDAKKNNSLKYYKKYLGPKSILKDLLEESFSETRA